MGVNCAAAQSLEVPLHVLFGSRPKMLLSERDGLVETLGLDGQNETFRKGVQIGAACRQPQRLRTAVLEHLLEASCEQRISVRDQIFAINQEAAEAVRQSALAFTLSRRRCSVPGTPGLLRGDNRLSSIDLCSPRLPQ